MSTAEEVVAGLRSAGLFVATAESLTGGLLCSALVDVPGASHVVAGGVVAYLVPQKTLQLGVPADLLEAHGPVHPDVASAMAEGVRERFGVDVGISTTGVAGPEPHGGKPAGTVLIGVATTRGTEVFPHNFSGDRAQVRQAAVFAALSALAATLGEHSSERRS